jgi:uncharacterized protein (TIGR03437 family)
VKSLFKVCALGAIFAALSLAQPAITVIQNNYGLILPGLPNYGIAQGSLFIVKGSGLANSSTTLQSVPLQTTLNGVSISVTVNGTTVKPPLYYVLPTQLAAVLPSATPVGTGQLTVTNNGQTASAQIQVVQSAFGIDTLNGAGSGPAAAFDANTGNSLLGFANAANPGEFVVLWGSGVGPDPRNPDETILQTQNNLTNIPIEVDIGGISGNVTYRGRSQFPGVDQIDVVIPANVQPGCYVSVVVRTGNIVSNFASIPVAASGRSCSDTTTGFTSGAFQKCLNQASCSIGSISLGVSVNTTQPITVGGMTFGGGTTTTVNAGADFFRYTAAQFSASTFPVATIGSCVIFSSAGNNAGTTNPVQPTSLNAGPAINVNGPNGKVALPFQNGFYYSTTQLPNTFIPSGGGTFNFDNGSGGPDVGAFTTQAMLSAPLVWSNMSSITTVNRSQGVTVNWTGGAPNSYVSIGGVSIGGTQSAPLAVIFVCSAPVSALTFTVPAAVLLALPPSLTMTVGGVAIAVGGGLSVSNYSNPVSFTAPGLDLGYVSAYYTNGTSVTYQ